MIVTIDGPAGAGKSSVAKALAVRLGFEFLDTGAMYRAVTLAAEQNKLDWQQPQALTELARRISIELTDQRVMVDGADVTAAIRSPEVTALSKYAAGNREVRNHLVQLQRQHAAEKDIVTEGRDQGTIVFPDAQCKIFLTASAEERATRRLDELLAQKVTTTFEEVLVKQNERDDRDINRDCGALIQAEDAVEVVTDNMTADEVVDRLESIVREKM